MQKANAVLVEPGYNVLEETEYNNFLVSCPACPTQALGDSAMTHAEPGGEPYEHDDRRLSYRIPFRCENGHAFWLNIRQHKGNTYLETEFRGLTECWCIEGEPEPCPHTP
ncbi:hypothetical protein [Streptomyces sp. HNA39]|uniref:hypothetical protein n=1 Tax=Streptomyces sp. HNA39 TaxID=2850561 RepID=UPI002010A684|nr:hypothetical protein [Streptomyces sp. HNA39]UQA37506.1 hypothetical protein KRR37_30110 [Streptomyces sp. HNA39]